MKIPHAVTRPSGYTLPGILTSVASLGLVILGVSCFVPRQGGLKAAVACPSLTTQDQDASGSLARDIRAADSIKSPQPNQLLLAGAQGTIQYTYDAADQSLTRTSGGLSRKLLTGVDFFSFSLLRRAGPEAPIGTMAPAGSHDARAVSCRWSCSFKVAGVKLDSETFQMAPVVMRHR